VRLSQSPSPRSFVRPPLACRPQNHRRWASQVSGEEIGKLKAVLNKYSDVASARIRKVPISPEEVDAQREEFITAKQAELAEIKRKRAELKEIMEANAATSRSKSKAYTGRKKFQQRKKTTKTKTKKGSKKADKEEKKKKGPNTASLSLALPLPDLIDSLFSAFQKVGAGPQ